MLSIATTEKSEKLYTKCSNLKTERQIPYDIAYLCNLRLKLVEVGGRRVAVAEAEAEKSKNWGLLVRGTRC